MAGFAHDVAGGQGNLIIAQLQSPNFSLAGQTGWAILKNGSAYFFNVTASGAITATQVIAGTAPNTQVELTSVSGTGRVVFVLNNAGFLNGGLFSRISGTTAQEVIEGPVNNTAGWDDQAYIQISSSDGSANAAQIEFFYIDANAVPWLMAAMDYTGFSVLAGSVTAVEPGTGTGTTNAAQPETWHPVSFKSGWSGTAKYKLYPDDTVGLTGDMTLPSSGYNNSTMFTLPAAYKPITQKAMPFAVAGWTATTMTGLPWLNIDTSGNVTLQDIPNGAGGTSQSCDGIRFPLDA